MKAYATVWMAQAVEINKYCFGECGKANISLVMDEQLGGLSTCNVEKCPFLDKQIDEPVGEVEGDNVYLRKLIPAERIPA